MDLVKGFDRVVRELVFGWPAGVEDPSAYLAQLGLKPDQIKWIAEYVAKHGSVLHQWGIEEKVIKAHKEPSRQLMVYVW